MGQSQTGGIILSDYPIATMEEWEAFLRTDKFYTAPEFLMQKFFMKTGKIPPQEVITKFEGFEGRGE